MTLIRRVDDLVDFIHSPAAPTSNGFVASPTAKQVVSNSNQLVNNDFLLPFAVAALFALICRSVPFVAERARVAELLEESPEAFVVMMISRSKYLGF